jgi:CheY-like chemotaxis protein
MAEQLRAARTKALIVDDDQVSASLLKAAMKEQFEVELETSGAQAISRASQMLPNVILLDINMPNVDGYEVLRQLKLHPMISAIPIICLTGERGAESRERAFSLGAAGYLLKPINVKTVSKDLQDILASINIVMNTEKRKFVIAFNQAEKYRALKTDVYSFMEQNVPTVILSLLNGAEFTNPQIDSGIEQGKLVYLQIVPSLIAKFQYLADLNPVLADLKGFCAGNSADYALVFDDPHLVINFQDSQNALSRMHSLKEMLSTSFKSVSFYCAREVSPGAMTTMNEMASIFCR